MKNTIVTASVLALSALASSNIAQAQYFPIAKQKSSVKWYGSKGIKALGSHTGTVAIETAKVDINKKGEIKKAEIEIDLSQMTSDDLEGALAQKLLGHLQSKDFFDIKNHKIAKFKSKSVKKINDKQYEFQGDLTIKDISKPISFVGTYTNNDKHKLIGEFKFDRTDYKIRYGSGQFFTNLGDKLIHDEVLVSFDLITE